MSTLQQRAAHISAKRKFDETYRDGADDIAALGKFLNETWDKHRDAFYEDAKTNEKMEYEFCFKMPEGLAFSREDVKDVLLSQVDDFKGISIGLYVFYKKDDLFGEREGGSDNSFRVQISYRYEHDEALRELRKQRRVELKRKLEEANKATKEDKVIDPVDEGGGDDSGGEEEEGEEEGCWNVVIPAKNGEPERRMPVSLAFVDREGVMREC